MPILNTLPERAKAWILCFCFAYPVLLCFYAFALSGRGYSIFVSHTQGAASLALARRSIGLSARLGCRSSRNWFCCAYVYPQRAKHAINDNSHSLLWKTINPHCSAPRDKSQILQTGCKYNWTDLIRYWLIYLKIYKSASNPRSSTPARLLFSSKMRSFANPGQAAP